MPIDLDRPASTKEMPLRRHHVSAVVIELALLEEFLSQEWEMEFTLHTQIIDIGIVVAQVCHKIERAVVTRGTSISMTTNPLAIQEFLNSYSKDVGSPRCLLCPETRLHNQEMLDTWPLLSTPSWSLAYILHTSGTTGEPKAIRVPHCCIVPNVLSLRTRFSVHPDDIVLNAAPLTFDPSVVEIFLSLYSGAALLVVPPALKKSPSFLAQAVLIRQHVTILQATPSLVQRLAECSHGTRLLGSLSNLSVLALGGESFPGLELVRRWMGGVEEMGTRVFNLYGVTEVSSWASCYLVPPDKLCPPEGDEGDEGTDVMKGSEVPIGKGEVPIGEPLLGTCIELRTEEGVVEGRGWGEIWIGGVYRICLLGEERDLIPSCMRATGDIGYQDERGSIYCVGRSDQQLKRAGHRVHLNTIQQVLSTSLDFISSCAVVSLRKKDLKHFSWKEIHSVASDVILLLFIVPKHTKLPPVTTSALFHRLQVRMGQLLPSHCIPDDVIFVREIPISAHGKVDSSALMSNLPSYIMTTPSSRNSNLSLSPAELQDMLVRQAVEVLGLGEWPSSSSLLALGVDSFGAMRMTNQMERQLRERLGEIPSLPLLGEAMMANSPEEIVCYILGVVQGGGGETRELPVASLVKRKTARGMGVSSPVKKVRVAPIRSYCRGACLEEGARAFPAPRVHKGTQQPLPSGGSVDRGERSSPRDVKCVFRQRWVVDTGKCVDASPLVVQQEGADTLVYCGSHSGLFVAVELSSGKVRWRQRLSDRVESSACVCGKFVAVGCYDGCLYVLNRHDGDLHWCFQGPGHEPVKSSPVFDPVTGWVWFGSHDQHLYCLDVQGKNVVFRLHLGGGSCFSSPCVAYGNRSLYVATLGGSLFAVDMDTGVVLWRFECSKPVFSSCCPLPGGGMVVGCVDGGVYMLDKEGHMVASYHTFGPVFSSCCFLPPLSCDHHMIGTDLTNQEPGNQPVQTTDAGKPSDDHQVATMMTTTHGDLHPTAHLSPSTAPGPQRYYLYCGSHDKYVYCWDNQLQLVWKRELDSEVYSIPFVAALVLDTPSGPHRHPVAEDDRLPCVCVCAVSGRVYVLDATSGTTLGHTDLPWQVYSSPVLMDGLLIVGCRDNNIYCMNVELCSN